MKRLSFVGILFITLLLSCSTEDDVNGGGGDQSGFDRKVLLENVADNIAIPAYENLAARLNSLQSSTTAFTTTVSVENLTSLRTSWKQAYVSWQAISFLEIGKAEEISFRNFMNVYPVTVADIEANISSGSYDLSLVSKQDEQGFAAIDYLLNGIGTTDEEVVAVFNEPTTGANYRQYLTDVVARMVQLTDVVVSDWKGAYRDNFVNNSGSSATSSFDKLVNDYLFHYEKHLRAGKIGIPAGAFNNVPLEDRVEAYYDGEFSKTLFLANLNAMQDFFNGKHFDAATNGESFKTYLEYLNRNDLSTLINDQFDIIRLESAELDDNFSAQVRTNNTLMLQTFDNLQANVVLLKVDMLSAFSVSVDFIDADGD
ncbi:imelysin family protein [Aquimarina brevivitae]|uniref:Imelysin n=1 Tax=Aquimarina brevivitae TaxID=323412 RepID=A0A4Q7P1C4_9FLAO|nr:imelysin family protein [Aquimarina brevivitae]RZS93170.1 imelysin [Aquimarina brevivitae]